MKLASSYFSEHGPCEAAKREFRQGCKWADEWVKRVALPLFMSKLVLESVSDEQLCAIVCTLYPTRMPSYVDKVVLGIGSAACVLWTFRPWDWTVRCLASCKLAGGVSFLSPQNHEAFVSLPWVEGASGALLQNARSLYCLAEKGSHKRPTKKRRLACTCSIQRTTERLDSNETA